MHHHSFSRHILLLFVFESGFDWESLFISSWTTRNYHEKKKRYHRHPHTSYLKGGNTFDSTSRAWSTYFLSNVVSEFHKIQRRLDMQRWSPWACQGVGDLILMVLNSWLIYILSLKKGCDLRLYPPIICHDIQTTCVDTNHNESHRMAQVWFDSQHQYVLPLLTWRWRNPQTSRCDNFYNISRGLNIVGEESHDESTCFCSRLYCWNALQTWTPSTNHICHALQTPIGDTTKLFLQKWHKID